MLNMNNLIRGPRVPPVYSQLKRYKNKNHWTNIENRNFPRFKALKHFDEFYESIFGASSWRSLRLGLLCNNKYCAVVNNYSDPQNITRELENKGALNMRVIFEMHRETLMKNENYSKDDTSSETADEMQSRIDSIILEKSKYDKLSTTFGRYERAVDGDEKKFLIEEIQEEPEVHAYVGKLSLSEGLKDANLDYSRIIDPKRNVSASTLYEFIPATKIKGMDNWISEEQHYEFYRNSLDFPINVEKDEYLMFPEYLNVYTYEKCNITSFSRPKQGATGVLDYFLLDGASILPILALDFKKGDRLLDMCGAPGGKSITAMQTLLPDKVVCNDKSKARAARIQKVAQEYLFYPTGDNKFSISCKDALDIKEENHYNKILVDVPCTNDRVSVSQDENNYFVFNRTKERLLLPEVQSKLLAAALRLVATGGIVVYSTCSLSPIQNDGVVQMALKSVWNDSDAEFVVRDLKHSFRPLNIIYHLGTEIGMKYGILALPHLTANFGPMYISKIERVK